MRSDFELSRPGDDPWVEATGPDYAAVGCGAGEARYFIGYRDAADLLFRALAVEDWFTPMVMPYLYVWRHYVELHLKRLHRLGTGREAPPEHGLLALWKRIRLKVPLPDGEEDQLQMAFEGLEDVLRRLDEVDPSSTDTRYHAQRDGTRSMANGPRHLNVEAYQDVMSRAANLLARVDHLLEFGIEPAAER